MALMSAFTSGTVSGHDACRCFRPATTSCGHAPTLDFQARIGAIVDLKPAAARTKSDLPESARSYPMNVANPKFNAPETLAPVNDATVTSEQFFAQLRGALTDSLRDGPEKVDTLTRLDALEKAKGYTFLRYYSTFIASAANHMNVVGPFIPGLTSIMVRV
jgi:hypothetical protein